MALFSEQKKLYFVFDDKGGKHFLESMLQLKTDPYLWWELLGSDYRLIYFVGEAGDKYLLKAYDETSRDEFGTKKWTDSDANSYGVILDDAKLRKWVSKVLVNSSAMAAAIVFSPEAFCSLYRDPSAKKSLESLIERRREKSTLIIRTQMSLSRGQINCFCSPNSPLLYQADKSGQSLCPLLNELAKSDSAQPVFRQMKQRLGLQYIELGTVTYEKMKTLMRCVRFFRGQSWSEDETLNYANILYSWWYLPTISSIVELPAEFIKGWNELFFHIRKKSNPFPDLFNELCGQGWKAFRDRVDMLPEYDKATVKLFRHTVSREYLESGCALRTDHAQLEELCTIPWPGAAYEQTVLRRPVLAKADKRKFKQMQDSLRAPYNRVPPSDRMEHLVSYLGYLKSAKEAKDNDTLCRAVNALMFGGRSLYCDNNEQIDYDQLYENFNKYLAVSSNYFASKMQQPVYGDSPLAKGLYLQKQANETAQRETLQHMDESLAILPELNASTISQAKELQQEFSRIVKTLFSDGTEEEEEETMSEEERLARLRARAGRR